MEVMGRRVTTLRVLSIAKTFIGSFIAETKDENSKRQEEKKKEENLQEVYSMNLRRGFGNFL